MGDSNNLNVPRPIAVKDAYSVQDKSKAHCPNCRQDIHGRGKIKRCFNCGQRLNWEERIRI